VAWSIRIIRSIRWICSKRMTSWRRMSDSSAEASSAFDSLKWSQVIALLDVLREYDLTDEWHVERRYKDLAQGYPQTVAFLGGIRLIEQVERRILIKTVAATERERRRDVIAQLAVVASPYREDLFRYLQGFRIQNGEVIRRA